MAITRESVIDQLLAQVPYVRWLGVTVDRHGDELTAVLGLLWATLDGSRGLPVGGEELPRLPKTIDFTVDYLRSGAARDAYARARVVRLGRRYASVQVEAWQDHRGRPFAQANGHFLMSRG